jgi:hypothetical protein
LRERVLNEFGVWRDERLRHNASLLKGIENFLAGLFGGLHNVRKRIGPVVGNCPNRAAILVLRVMPGLLNHDFNLLGSTVNFNREPDALPRHGPIPPPFFSVVRVKPVELFPGLAEGNIKLRA